MVSTISNNSDEISLLTNRVQAFSKQWSTEEYKRSSRKIQKAGFDCTVEVWTFSALFTISHFVNEWVNLLFCPLILLSISVADILSSEMYESRLFFLELQGVFENACSVVGESG